MKRKQWWTSVIVAAAVGLTAAGGYLLGEADAPTATEAAKNRDRSFEEAMKSSFNQAFQKAKLQGAKTGLARGKRTGQLDGTGAGTGAGAKRAQDELDLIAAEQARLAAEAEAAERDANCGHVLFVDDYCPTDAEVQYEEDAESYCGGGDYETAAALGIRC